MFEIKTDFDDYNDKYFLNFCTDSFQMVREVQKSVANAIGRVLTEEQEREDEE